MKILVLLKDEDKAKPNQPGPARPSQTHPNHEIVGLSKPYAKVVQNGPFGRLFKPVAYGTICEAFWTELANPSKKKIKKGKKGKKEKKKKEKQKEKRKTQIEKKLARQKP